MFAAVEVDDWLAGPSSGLESASPKSGGGGGSGGGIRGTRNSFLIVCRASLASAHRTSLERHRPPTDSSCANRASRAPGHCSLWSDQVNRVCQPERAPETYRLMALPCAAASNNSSPVKHQPRRARRRPGSANRVQTWHRWNQPETNVERALELQLTFRRDGPYPCVMGGGWSLHKVRQRRAVTCSFPRFVGENGRRDGNGARPSLMTTCPTCLTAWSTTAAMTTCKQPCLHAARVWAHALCTALRACKLCHPRRSPTVFGVDSNHV